jgi:hypothetical protein
VMSFCNPISKCVDVGIRAATEFDFTSTLLVCRMTWSALLCNL